MPTSRSSGTWSLVGGIAAFVGLLAAPLLRTNPEQQRIGTILGLGALALVPLAAGLALYAVAKSPVGTRRAPFATLCILVFLFCTFAMTAMTAMPTDGGVWSFAVGVGATSVVGGGGVVWRAARDARYLGVFMLMQGALVLFNAWRHVG